MNFSKIRLNNERNEHVTKRLNRLNTWNFFKVLYRENIWRLFGFSILMILCLAPVFAVLILNSFNNATLLQSLPQLNSFGFSTGAWEGLTEHYAEQLAHNNLIYGLYAVLGSLLATVVFSGGYAVIRDAFWTGKLSAVGIFKSIGMGLKANILYSFVTTVVLSFTVFGLYNFYVWGVTVMPLWLTIVLLVLLCIIAMFLAIYLMILCSVSVTYKQSVYDNLDDSWRLMWLNILPNIIHFLIAVIPVGLYFAFRNSMLNTIFMVLVLMFGGMYFPLVWHTHMMKTFALFHPVEVKKKKQAQREAQAALVQSQPEHDEQKPAAKGKKGKKNKSAVVEEAQADEAAREQAFTPSDSDDPYAVDEEIAPISDISEEPSSDAASAEETQPDVSDGK